jgi:hypothetical protein
LEPPRLGFWRGWRVMTETSLVSVYAGQVCLGFVLARGEAGFEAFDADEKSLGLFPTQREAAAAIMRGAP